ncbi:membrane protein [Planomonospora venezuelensis]|nr:membrane protein [Planomonospora venezuelensis]
MIAGAVRLTELAGGAAITPENARFFAAPLPVVLHIVGVSLYSVLGAFQFAAGFRRRRPGWHRAAGRVLVPAGLVAALSGLWMTLFYPLPAGDGDLLSAIRLVFGSAMALAIVLGLAAIRRRDVARHRAWMIRGYAIGLGAGTQVLTHVPWFLVLGTPGEFPRAMLMAAGWVINLAVAEWVIRRRPVIRSVSPAGPAGASAGGLAGR